MSWAGFRDRRRAGRGASRRSVLIRRPCSRCRDWSVVVVLSRALSVGIFSSSSDRLSFLLVGRDALCRYLKDKLLSYLTLLK